MDDRELDIMLRDIARRRVAPPADLVRRTKARVQGRRLLQTAIGLSIAMQLAAAAGVIYVLSAPQALVSAKLFGAAGLVAWAGAVAVAIVGARGHVAWFFRRVEHVMG